MFAIVHSSFSKHSFYNFLLNMSPCDFTGVGVGVAGARVGVTMFVSFFRRCGHL